MPTYGDETLLERYQREALVDERIAARFKSVSCSQCGQSFGPGDSGFSHCADHEAQHLPAEHQTLGRFLHTRTTCET